MWWLHLMISHLKRRSKMARAIPPTAPAACSQVWPAIQNNHQVQLDNLTLESHLWSPTRCRPWSWAYRTPWSWQRRGSGRRLNNNYFTQSFLKSTFCSILPWWQFCHFSSIFPQRLFSQFFFKRTCLQPCRGKSSPRRLHTRPAIRSLDFLQPFLCTFSTFA